MTLWHVMPGDVPVDGAWVWVRRWWFGAPWLAQWSEAGSVFTSEAGLEVPWYEVSRWKHQVEP